MSAQRPSLFIIAGVNKAGTTSAFAYLSGHRDICAARIKETGFFLPLRYAGEPEPDVAAYDRLFPDCAPGAVRMEATPGYFYGGRRLASFIARHQPDARVMIILREPGARLVSFFRRKRSTFELPAHLTVRSYIDECLAMPEPERSRRDRNPYWGVDGGHYARWLPDWIDVFGDRLRIEFFDDLKADPRAFAERTAAWLGLDPAAFRDFGFHARNETRSGRLAPLHRLAVRANRRFERAFQSRPRLKRALSGLYYRLNGSKGEDAVDPADLAAARGLYVESNAELAELLRAQGRNDLPGWLDAAPAERRA